MPRGRSTFTKRQKEQARQQKQRDKAERKSQRKQEKQEGSVDEMRELREHAAAQAALFRVGPDASSSVESSTTDDSNGVDREDARGDSVGAVRGLAACTQIPGCLLLREPTLIVAMT